MMIKFELLKFIDTCHELGLEEVTLDYLWNYFDRDEQYSIRMHLARGVKQKLLDRHGVYPNYSYILTQKGKSQLEKYLTSNFGVETTPRILFNIYGDWLRWVKNKTKTN